MRDNDFLDHVRAQRCLIHQSACRGGRIDPDHLKTRGSGGSDYTAVPLDRILHTERHQIGDARFEQKYRVNLWRESHAIVVPYLLARIATLEEEIAQLHDAKKAA